MFHVDVGKVFIWPEPIRKKDIGRVKLPKGFDSVMVHLKDLNITAEPRLACIDQDNVVEAQLANDSHLMGDENISPSNFTKHFLIFDLERIKPAYQVSFKLKT